MTTHENPARGGSYIRKDDGSLERVDWTEGAAGPGVPPPPSPPQRGEGSDGAIPPPRNREGSRKVKETGNG